MSRKPYAPRPGSAPAIVIDHLRAAGGTLTSAQFAELTGCNAQSAFAILQSAMRHGVIVRAPGSTPTKTLFALADGAHTALDAATEPEPKAGRRRTGARRKTAPRRRAPAQDAEHSPAPDLEASPAADAAADAPSGPVACLWDDGEIVLHGLVPNADGSTATLSEAHARRLHAFLDRLYGTPVARPLQGGGGLVYAAHVPTPPLMLAQGPAR